MRYSEELPQTAMRARAARFQEQSMPNPPRREGAVARGMTPSRSATRRTSTAT